MQSPPLASTPAGNDRELMFKTVVVGDSAVGKTNLTFRYAEDRFEESPLPTVGVDFLMKETTFKDTRVKLQIWDTAGQERFKAITRSLYHGARGAMVVYDITNHDSFTHVGRWLEELRSNVHTKLPIILVGNKSDLVDERRVPREEAEKYAREEGVCFMETSALESSNVDAAFEWLTAEMCSVVSSNPYPTGTHATFAAPSGVVVLPAHTTSPKESSDPTAPPAKRRTGCCK